MRPYRFHPKALAEYEAAVTWYADRSFVAGSPEENAQSCSPPFTPWRLSSSRRW